MGFKRISAFLCVAMTLFSVTALAEPMPATCTMQLDRPVYDANTDFLYLSITNGAGVESGYGEPFQLQRQHADTWVDVAPDNSGDIIFTDTWAILPPGKTNRETLDLAAFPTPLPCGRYRVVKTVDGAALTAEFDIPDPALCLRLDELHAARLTLHTGETEGTLSLGGPDGATAALQALWHELLAFREGIQPQNVPADPAVELALRGSDWRQDINLYEIDGRTWAQTAKGWYWYGDTGPLRRLEQTAAELGAYAPATGEALITALNGTQAFKHVSFVPSTFTSPFSLSGWKSGTDSGILLSIFQFPNADDVNRQMRFLYDNGYTLGIERREGDAISFRRERFDWKQPPHYFKAGSRLVLYLGSDKNVLDTLTGLLGPQVEPQPD